MDLGKDNCKTRREVFKSLDLVRLIQWGFMVIHWCQELPHDICSNRCLQYILNKYCYKCIVVYGAMCISLNDLSQDVSDHVFTWGIYSNMSEYNNSIFETIFVE